MGPDAPGSGDVTLNGRHVHDMSWPLHEVGALLESRFSIPGEAGSATCSRAGREGWTVFASSHLMAEMALTADEVIIMPAGRRAPSQQDPRVGGAGRACAAAPRQALI